MKKVIFFAFALIASALVFTACNGNDASNPLVGTWKYIEENGDIRSEQKVTFEGNNNFSQSGYMYMSGQVHYGHIYKGTYKINGDEVNIHYTGFSWTDDGVHIEEQTDFQPFDDWFKYSINGNTLTIIRGDNTETYTKQ